MPLISSSRLYTGRRISLDLDTVRFPDGSTGTLELVRHPGAAAVVPFLDPFSNADPRVLLLRQFRHAADDYLWEIPAGTLHRDEAPYDCAARELQEEAGVDADDLLLLTTIYTTPGFTDERIHLYLGIGLSPARTALEPDEFLEVHEMRWSAIGRMIRDGSIRDGKTLVSLMWVQSFLR